MRSILIFAIFIQLSQTLCAYQCSSCQIDSNPYTCITCSTGPEVYLWSCPIQNQNAKYFLIVTVLVTALHLFMLAMGIGIYRQVFENIQLASLVTWRYEFQGGAYAIQGTNLAFVKNNNFVSTFGFQFILLAGIFLGFWMLYFLSDKSTHNRLGLLVQRKRIIFSFRVITFIFNILLFCGLVQISTVKTQPSFPIFPFVIAILGLVSVGLMLIGVAVASNLKNFRVDDPNYYVIVEQMVTKSWYARNNTLISLIIRGGIILSYTLLFKIPEIAGIIMISLQICYTLYYISMIRFTKIRYYAVIVMGNIIMIGVLLAIYIGAISEIQSNLWQQLSKSYQTLLFILIAIYLFASFAQIVIKKQIIAKQLKSIYQLYLKCQQSKQQITVNKYDKNPHREKVTEFTINLLYKKKLTVTDQIEMRTIQ